ncbi:MAG: 50S ribosomal protein L4, partial [Firmicutes bacterium]|nr:50S ribosomal protein L4 [Bacillota bacterium]
MPSIGVYNEAGERVGEVHLKEEIFGIEPHGH